MLRSLSVALVLATTLAACSAADDSLADVEVAETAKADTLANPTRMGDLELKLPETHSWVPRSSGYHLYGFAGQRGWKVSFTLKSGTVRTYLRVTAPSGRRWNVPGVRASNGAWYSTLTALALPETGNYRIVASTYANLQSYPVAHSAGEYTLSADANVFCGGIAAFRCPDYLTCLLDGSYPDAGGSCQLPDACHVAGDCAALPNLCGGTFACNVGRGAVGTCELTCPAVDPCASLDTTACSRNARCEVYAYGCDRPSCQPDGEGGVVCHPCDPIPACRTKR